MFYEMFRIIRQVFPLDFFSKESKLSTSAIFLKGANFTGDEGFRGFSLSRFETSFYFSNFSAHLDQSKGSAKIPRILLYRKSPLNE